MAIVIDILHADGVTAERRFDQEEIAVGRGREADLSIPRAPELEPIHLLLIPRSAGCWISTAREAKVRPLLDGKRFDNGLVPWGSELDVGSVSIRVRKPPVARNWKRLPILVALVPVAIVAVMIAGDSAGLPTSRAEAPHLFAYEDEASASCSEPGRPAERATEAADAAEAAEVRYAYDRQEGLRAVAEWRQAELCARLARDQAGAAAARRRRDALVVRLDGDYKAHRVELTRARKAKDMPRLLAAVRGMKAYLAHRPGTYYQWLESLERHALTRMDKNVKKSWSP